MDQLNKQLVKEKDEMKQLKNQQSKCQPEIQSEKQQYEELMQQIRLENDQILERMRTKCSNLVNQIEERDQRITDLKHDCKTLKEIFADKEKKMKIQFESLLEQLKQAALDEKTQIQASNAQLQSQVNYSCRLRFSVNWIRWWNCIDKLKQI